MNTASFTPAAAVRAIGCIALGLVIAAYTPCLRGPFLFDDLSEIATNPAIRTLLPPWRPMFAGGELPHRPIPYLSFALSYQCGRLVAWCGGPGPLDPLPFHAVSIAIHLLNGWLVFSIVRRLLALPPAGPTMVVAGERIAATAAAIWLVHPLQSQAVSYVYQRIELLAACAALATCAAFLRAATTPRPLPWVATAVAACGLGMACKEWVIVVPVVILLLDRAFLAASWREVFERRGRWHLALFATWPILFAIVAAERDRYPEAGFTAWQAVIYAANQPLVILWYLSRLVLPLGLSIDHGAVLRRDLLGRDAWLILPAVGMLAAAGWALAALARRPAAAWSILAFLLLLAPTSSIVPVQDACVEHRMYLAAAIPITAAVVFVAGRLPLPLPAVAAVLVALAALTGGRTTVYRSALAIWGDAVVKSGGSSRSLARYGSALSAADRHTEAVTACTAAVERNPASPVPYAALAAALLNADQPQRAAEVCRAGLAVRGKSHPWPFSTWPTAGKAEVFHGRQPPHRAPADFFHSLLATQADATAAYRDPLIDRLAMYLGVALDRLGDPRGEQLLRAAAARSPDSLQAQEHFARSIVRSDPQAAAAVWSRLAAVSPDDPFMLFQFGSAVARFDPAAAVPLLERTLAIDPTNADACNNLGNAFLTLGRHAEAAAAYRRCLRLAPGHPQASANLRTLEAESR